MLKRSLCHAPRRVLVISFHLVRYHIILTYSVRIFLLLFHSVGRLFWPQLQRHPQTNCNMMARERYFFILRTIRPPCQQSAELRWESLAFLPDILFFMFIYIVDTFSLRRPREGGGCLRLWTWFVGFRLPTSLHVSSFSLSFCASCLRTHSLDMGSQLCIEGEADFHRASESFLCCLES